MSAEAAVGFRVKSGWATAVLLVGPARAPRVADRRVIELSDPAVPTSRQPYHAVMDAAPARGAKLERRLRSVVARITRRSVRRALPADSGARPPEPPVPPPVRRDLPPAATRHRP